MTPEQIMDLPNIIADAEYRRQQEEHYSEDESSDKPATFWINAKKKVSALRFHPKNPRIITEKGIGDMKASIAEFGYTEPVLINLDNVIIAGHKRVSAFLDWDQGNQEIDVRVPNRLLSVDEHERLMLKDNKMEEGNWDYDKLNNEFELVQLEDAGFTEANLTSYGPEPEKKEKEVKEKINKICPHCGGEL